MACRLRSTLAASFAQLLARRGREPALDFRFSTSTDPSSSAVQPCLSLALKESGQTPHLSQGFEAIEERLTLATSAEPVREFGPCPPVLGHGSDQDHVLGYVQGRCLSWRPFFAPPCEFWAARCESLPLPGLAQRTEPSRHGASQSVHPSAGHLRTNHSRFLQRALPLEQDPRFAVRGATVHS